MISLYFSLYLLIAFVATALAARWDSPNPNFNDGEYMMAGLLWPALIIGGFCWMWVKLAMKVAGR